MDFRVGAREPYWSTALRSFTTQRGATPRLVGLSGDDRANWLYSFPIQFKLRGYQCTICPQNISISRSLAPRQVGFWGIVENSPGIQHKPLIADQNEKITIQPTSGEADGLDAILIANFTYDAHSTAVVQGYGSISGARERSMPFTSIVVFVQDNWGDDEATCLCGVHVYGQRVNMEGNSSYI